MPKTRDHVARQCREARDLFLQWKSYLPARAGATAELLSISAAQRPITKPAARPRPKQIQPIESNVIARPS
jgi:hypothetical protein